MNKLDRRAVLQRALLLAGAGMAPSFSLKALAQEAAKGERLLDARQFGLLSAVADTMVPRTDTPGAVDAGVPALFDGLLKNWASPKRREELLAALEVIGRLGQQDGQPFVALSAERRHALLADYDVAALKPARPDAAATFQRAPAIADPRQGQVLQRPVLPAPAEYGPSVAEPAYAKLKELIVVLYYLTEAALTHELQYEHAPGGWKPSIPVTPQTRASGGPGRI
jgi:gluconate 2-dehydrogenase gamma chain